jgi:ABC-type dipeptide/oligopeptide/nickel transport system permease component
MKINLFTTFLILAIISFFIMPFIAGAYDSYITSKKPMCFEGLGCLKEEAKQEALENAREEISQRPFIARYKLNLGSSLVYWYFWFIPLIFLGLAWYINNKKS